MHDLRLRRVRDVLLEQLDDARRKLTKSGRSDSAVHDVRKELTRARAALRLLRKSVGAPRYRHYNRTMRDVARILTPLRDAKVLLRTLGRLRSVDDDEAVRATGSALARQFREERHAVGRRLLRRHLAAAAHALRGVKERIGEIPRARLDEVAIGWGISRAYEAGRSAARCAKDEPTDTRLHEWRKQVKYLIYQIDVARQLRAAKLNSRLKKRRKYLRRLAEVLGDDHDLAVLDARMAASTAHDSSRRFALRIHRRRTALQREARRLGKLLYGGKVKRLRSELEH